MAWSAGTFTRSNGATGWADDQAAGIGITSAKHDTLDNDLATGINTCLTKDGQNAATGNLPMGAFRHTNVATAAARTDYARADQVQESSLMWSGNIGGSGNTFTMTLVPAIPAYVSGQRFGGVMPNANTGAATLNVNGLGAKAIQKINDGVILSAGDLLAGETVWFTYDGTQFVLEQASGVLNTLGSNVTTVNTTNAETTVFTYSVPANMLGANRGIRAVIYGDILNNTGLSRSINLKAVFGSTNILSFGTPIAFGTSATRYAFKYEIELIARDASTQMGFATWTYPTVASGTAATPFTPGIGCGQNNSITEDQTSAKILKLTTTMSVSDVNLETRVVSALVERI